MFRKRFDITFVTRGYSWCEFTRQSSTSFLCITTDYVAVPKVSSKYVHASAVVYETYLLCLLKCTDRSKKYESRGISPRITHSNIGILMSKTCH